MFRIYATAVLRTSPYKRAAAGSTPRADTGRQRAEGGTPVLLSSPAGQSMLGAGSGSAAPSQPAAGRIAEDERGLPAWSGTLRSRSVLGIDDEAMLKRSAGISRDHPAAKCSLPVLHAGRLLKAGCIGGRLPVTGKGFHRPAAVVRWLNGALGLRAGRA